MDMVTRLRAGSGLDFTEIFSAHLDDTMQIAKRLPEGVKLMMPPLIDHFTVRMIFASLNAGALIELHDETPTAVMQTINHALHNEGRLLCAQGLFREIRHCRRKLLFEDDEQPSEAVPQSDTK